VGTGGDERDGTTRGTHGARACLRPEGRAEHAGTLHAVARPARCGLPGPPGAGADRDGAPIPFHGHTIRVSGCQRDEPRQVVTDAGPEVIEEDAHACRPAGTGVPPGPPVLPGCRRG